MTPNAILRDGLSLTARLAEFFEARPDTWIDGRDLARVAGAYGWRTRVSECRRGPHFLNIENQLRTMKMADGQRFTVSEYRLVSTRAGEEKAGERSFGAAG